MNWNDEGGRAAAIVAAKAIQPPHDGAAPGILHGSAVDRAALDYAQSRSVVICTPIGYRNVPQYTDKYCETRLLLERFGIRHARQFAFGRANVPMARNEMTARLLASDYTDAMFIDDDMNWDPMDVVRLIAAPHRVIAGVGRKRVDLPNNDPQVWCAYFPRNARIVSDGRGCCTSEDGKLKVGAAFLKVQREAFETMATAHPEWKRDGHAGMPENVKALYHQWFLFNPETEGGEDFTFCERWWEFGRVWIAPTINLGHVGDKEWSGAFSELMMQAAVAVEDMPQEPK
jgi:hypothetical protein